ncbi:MAG: hypothetical protein ACFFDP_07090 [Promethearchaeota archaeon]
MMLTSVGFGSRELKLGPELVSGFLSAIRMFGQDLLADDITAIETGSYQFVWDFAEPVLGVALTDREDDEVAILAVLKTLNALFLERFQKELRNWIGEVAPFRNFNPVVREVIHDYLPTFEKPQYEIMHPEILRLWRRFDKGLDLLIYGLLAGIPLLVVGRKARNEVIIRQVRTLQQRRIPVMWFSEPGAAKQVLCDRPPYLSFILSLPDSAYESTFADSCKQGTTHVAIIVEEGTINSVGFKPQPLGIATTIDFAANVLGETGRKLRSIAETAFYTTRSRVMEVARLLVKTPNLPDKEAAALLRLMQQDYQIFKVLAVTGGYIRRERKRIAKRQEQ